MSARDAFFAAALLATLPACNVNQPGRGKICGFVSDLAGQPIASAAIGIFKRNAAGNWTTETPKTSGANGWFNLDLVPGTYALKFSHPNYITEFYRDLPDPGGDTVPNGVNVLTLVANQTMNDVNATLDELPGTRSDLALIADAVSECSRIDHDPSGKFFSVCAMPDLLPPPTATATISVTHTSTPQDQDGGPTESPKPQPQPTSPPPPLPDCPIVVSVTIPCANASAMLTILPQSTDISMDCGPSASAGKTTCTATLESLDHFVPKQIHTLRVTYECGTGIPMEATIGFAGFCDPSGHIGHRPHTIINPPDPTGSNRTPTPTPTLAPVVGARVTLFFVPQTEMTPDVPGSPSSHVDNNCYIFETRPTPATPLTAAGSDYWHNWSSIPSADPLTSPPTLTEAGAAQLKIAISPVATTTSTGAYGFLTQPGYCYAVRVVAPDESWTAWSPIVGNIATPTATPVLDLDLTHIDG